MEAEPPANRCPLTIRTPRGLTELRCCAYESLRGCVLTGGCLGGVWSDSFEYDIYCEGLYEDSIGGT